MTYSIEFKNRVLELWSLWRISAVAELVYVDFYILLVLYTGHGGWKKSNPRRVSEHGGDYSADDAGGSKFATIILEKLTVYVSISGPSLGSC